MPFAAQAKYALNPGDHFGRLELLGYLGGYKWHCRCDCGEQTVAGTYQMVNGGVKSCGCLQRESRIKHGLSQTNEHRIWRGMVARCHSLTNPAYAYYGGRGIRVADEWRHDFATFLADVGPRPSRSHSLDRIDNARGYEPGNVRWATAAEQSRNTRRNRWLEFRGERLTMTDMTARHGINQFTFQKRMRNGWTLEDALTVKP